MPPPHRAISRSIATTKLPLASLLGRNTNPHASHHRVANLPSRSIHQPRAQTRLQPLAQRALLHSQQIPTSYRPITHRATMSSSAPGSSTPSDESAPRKVEGETARAAAVVAEGGAETARASVFSDSAPVEEGEGKSKEQLLLEYKDKEAAEGEKTHTLDMSSGSANLRLDHLGPLVVHKDGTVSRIANWKEMAEIERQNTLRILGKRNQVRLEGLRAKEGESQEGEEGK